MTRLFVRPSTRQSVGILTTLMVMSCVLGLAFIFFGQRAHAPAPSRMIVTGPPEPGAPSDKMSSDEHGNNVPAGVMPEGEENRVRR
jgi:hypothetical protein